jgi:class 3 adenylate cyclase/predicted ATPase
MTFEELLDQAIALLQRRGRLTYRALKRQFDLDDDYLEDLKTELIKGQRLAVDEDGEVLVWIGGTDISPATIPRAVQSALLGPPTPLEAERRQLTVLFCDLVDSTTLASQLDPEEYRDVVRAYQTACTEVIRRYDGHIAQLLGDGLLVYFGYPQAHEDDAHRAVRTALGILAAMDDLHTRLPHGTGRTLAVRLGIHTGLVVIGAMGDQGRHEHLALGETPNIAARIQGLAAPNTVAISDATSRLVQGYFACQDLGAHALRGVPEAMRIYHVLDESGATSRLDVAQPGGLTPLVGRESEVTLLLERWEQAKAGHGHVVLLTGEGGIGKSRLVQVLKEHVANGPHVRWECRSVPYYQNTALYPMTDLFQRLLQFQTEDTLDAKLEKLAQMLSQYRLPLEDPIPLFAPLLSLPIPEERYPPLNLSPQRQRQKTLETIVAILLELAERQPVLFIVEDLHWTDPTTLELLNLLINQTPTASLLVLLTCRPHFQPAWHHRSYITEMTLNHLSHAQVAQIVTGMTDGKILPHEVLAQVVEKTDGVPLFVEEMTKAILESGQLTARDGHYELLGSLSTFAIPATLQDSLMARLDRLVTAKAVAQYAAVIGRQFPYELLQAVSQVDEAMLQHELGRLVEAEIVYQRSVPPQATYTFKHALIQDTAYQSLLKSTRQQYHQQIAQVLKEQFPETIAGQPELLAHHYTEAGLTEQAVSYWYKAGQSAIERSAHVEAIAHLRQGLALLKTLPETPEHARQALEMQTSLGLAFMATKGFAAPEVERAYTRARALCQRVGATAQLPPVLRGLWLFYNVRGEFRLARDLGEQLLTLAQRTRDQALLVEAHRAVGETLFRLGELAPARAHLEEGMIYYDPHQHRSHMALYGHDPGVLCLSYAARALWLLGYPDQALQRSHEVLALAQQLSHSHSLVFALYCAGRVHQFRREGQAALERAEALVAFAREQALPHWVASGTILRGWALAEQGQVEEGIAQMHQGLSGRQATGAELGRPYYLAQLAEAYGEGGRAEEGLNVLAEVLTVVHQQGERWGEAELYRLKGELLLRAAAGRSDAPIDPAIISMWAGAEPSVLAEAETCFQQALVLARRQEAKSLELRTATSLSRLWQRQGTHAEARQLLAAIYGWFTEGLDTADLQEAKALLDALA